MKPTPTNIHVDSLRGHENGGKPYSAAIGWELPDGRYHVWVKLPGLILTDKHIYKNRLTRTINGVPPRTIRLQLAVPKNAAMLESIMEHVNREGLVAKAIKAERDKEAARSDAISAERQAQREADLAVARAMIASKLPQDAPINVWLMGEWVDPLAAAIVDWVQRARIDGEGVDR
jgi:hypothetical protein